MTDVYPGLHYPPPGSGFAMSDIKGYEVQYRGYKNDPITAYVARPAKSGSYPGILLVHGIHGYEEHMRDMARRFSAIGYAAIVPALYSREEYLGVVEEEDFEKARKWLSSRPDAQTVGDLEEALTYCTRQEYVQPGKIGLIGFCSGGSAALLFACSTQGLSCFVNCYSGNIRRATETNPVPIIDRVKNLCCPMLGLFGRDDKNPSPQDVDMLRQALTRAEKTFDIVSYKNAGHAFLSDTRDSYRPEAAHAAWGRIVEWFSNYLKP
jgi:carboxymethylenebutenolidase